MEFTPSLLALVLGAFLLAGGIKGLVGVGLPTVAIAVLINAIEPRDAIPLVVIPAIATNIWQALDGGRGVALVKRFWPLLAMLCVGTWFGVEVLASSNQRLMSGIFGAILTLYALAGLLRPAPPPPGRAEVWLSPVIGFLNGIVNGLTGSYIIPGTLYLEALRLSRDELIQAMGILFLVASMSLGVSLTGHSVMTGTHALLSGLALIPAMLGYYGGQLFRQRLPEGQFRKIFFVCLVLLGTYTFVTCIFF
ncbi:MULTISPECIES: sulfite exporter TauE/SafE family protein [Rhodomicrobium]|uniref:sulfite exporter TauE/SafE family protein n=1 Tax=Rhodomicrobium TaxID=1068 RepID=UPI0014831948|nr:MULTISPECIES: sulfite exporter TauE/SafE family protein [Rhodomicrobium]